MYTASFAFLEAIWEAGITHCFVNLGSDHPSIMEAMAKGVKEKNGQFPRFITCPSEMVAMSMADGYARVTGKPQCVIIHVDVGTQALGCAVHNASVGRAPVLIFAGVSPITQEGELRGSRTEFIHWMQDVPDQKQIVAQYCRYTAEIKSGKNIKQMVNRAIQIASSAPAGPVYLCGSREVMEEEIVPYSVRQTHWKPIEPVGLSATAVESVVDLLVHAKAPLIITGYSGRNKKVPAQLVKLADTIKGIRVLDTGGSDMNFPADHPAWLSLRYGIHECIETADVILVLDCDVPWIPTQCKPSKSATIVHIDVDPLKRTMTLFYLAVTLRYCADAFTALCQINEHLMASPKLTNHLSSPVLKERSEALRISYAAELKRIADLAKPQDDGSFGTGYLCSMLRKVLPQDTLFCVEAVTNTFFVADNIQATIPGSFLNCGGGGLGWSGGAALGIKLATDYESGGPGKGKFVCQIVGDGSFMFSFPGSVYWISQRYNIPVLTIVLNNGGWNAPRKSLLLVHPDGFGSKATNEDINISFDPVPEYAGIAKAAAGGNIFAAKVQTASQIEETLNEAIKAVMDGRTAVIDAVVRKGT